MKIDINLGNISINNVSINSSVQYGKTALNGWQIRAKTNTSLGRVNGDQNVITNRLNLLNDQDVIDMTVKTT